MSRLQKSRHNPISNFMNSNRKVQPNQRTAKPTGSSVRRIKVLLSIEKTLDDIAHVLRTKYKCDLGNCRYYLNDHVLLEGHQPISSHCTQTQGLVAVIMEIKSMPTHYEKVRYCRLNIVDILVPNQNDPSSIPDHEEMIISDINQTGSEMLDGAPLDPLMDNLNPDGLSAEQESMMVPQQHVADAFSAATRAFEDFGGSSNSSPSNPYLPPQTLPSPSNSVYSGPLDFTEVSYGGKWIIDENYRRRLEENKIPRDPTDWDTIHVVMWINWALKEFEMMGKTPTDPRHVPPNGGGDGGKLAKVFMSINGKQLIGLTLSQLIEMFKTSRSPASINVNFLTHFQLLKSCHEACVPFKTSPQSYPAPVSNYSSQRLNRPTNRPKSRTARLECAPYARYNPLDTNFSNSHYYNGNGGSAYPSSQHLLRLNSCNQGPHRSKIVKSESYPRATPAYRKSNILTSAVGRQPSLRFGNGVTGTSNLNDYMLPSASAAVSAMPFESLDCFPNSFPLFDNKNSRIFGSGAVPTNIGQYRVVSGLSPSHRQESGALSMISPSHASCSSGNQIQLWQFLLDLLTDYRHIKSIHWVNGDGEFILANPEKVATLWGQRKNKPNMNYEKLSRALRYYYDGDMISKVSTRRFSYKFVCDLKLLLGYSASEIHEMVVRCALKHNMDLSHLDMDESRKDAFPEEEAYSEYPSPSRALPSTPGMLNGVAGFDSDSTSADVEVSPRFLRIDDDERVNLRNVPHDFNLDPGSPKSRYL